MGMRSGLRRWLALAVLSAGVVFAGEPVTAVPAADTGLKQVQERKTAAYREVLAAFDAAMLASPDDPAVAVARCEFVAQFTDDEYGEWVESAPADLERCSEALQARWPKAPVARMFALDQLWGEEAAELGEKLLADANDWPAPLRRRLLAKTSVALEDDDPERAGELAVMASRLGEGTRVPLAIEHLVAKREFAGAAALLHKTPSATEEWAANQRVSAALTLPDRQAALVELNRYNAADFDVDAAIAAKAYLRAGEIPAARKILQGETGSRLALTEAKFDTALAAGDMRAAAGLIDITEADDFATNIQRFAVVAMEAPGMLLSGPMLLAAIAAVALLLVLALMPGLILVPVHYRGLIRQVRGRPATPLFDSIGLRRAWLGAALMMCVPLVVAALLEPRSLATLLGGETLPEPDALFRITLWGTVAGLLCLVPIAYSMGMRQLVGDRAAFRASWRVLLAWAGLLVVGVLVGILNGQADTTTTQTKMVDALASGGRETYGLALTFLLMALLVPIFEELIFRGLILGGMTRYISFGWANTLQAALFAAIHDDLPRFPFYFTLGLLTGWLVKKTRALGPAIALHAANNALAVSLRMFV